MLQKKLTIFIYLLSKATQPLMASEVFYTNTIDPDSFLNFGRTIRKVDLNDNTFIKLMDNAVLCDVSNDQSLIMYSPANSLYEYSYPGEPQSFIIKNFYQYDTLNFYGHNAKFTSNGDIISFTTHSFDYYDLYYNDHNAGLSSIQTYSRSGDSITVLSDSIFYGFYILSNDKNRILWLEKVSAEDSLEIFIHTVDNGQTDTLNAKVSTTAFFDANESNLFFWGRNDLLYASLMDSNSVYCLFSIDISQNPDSFTKIFSSDADLFLLPTQDFEYDKFLFSQKIIDGTWYEKIWVHNINDESSEFVFDFFSGQSLNSYIWSVDTSKIYFVSSPTSWGYGGPSGPFYEYDFPSDLITILSNTYNFSFSSSLIHFDDNLNTGPSKTELINPLQNENVELNQYNINDSTTFSWSSSQDIDNDSLSYTLCFWDRDEYYDWIYGTQLTNPFKILEQNLTDTIITLSNSFLYDIFMEANNEDAPYFRWSVDVTDGYHILDMNYGNAHRITLNYVNIEYQKWHVSTAGSDSTGDGSLESPYSTIQKGINIASDGDTVFVSNGTYIENINFIGKNIALIGEDRETTIIDGYEGGSVVKFVSGEDENAKIMGFTLRNGFELFDFTDSANLDTTALPYIGGGIQLLDSSPKIEDLIITNNKAAAGAGISMLNSNPHIFDVQISDNYADTVSVEGDVSFITYGGGLCLSSSNPHISHSIITNNNGSYYGGGLFAMNNSSPTITHSNFVNNSAIAGNEIVTGFNDETFFSNGSGTVTITNSIIYNDKIFDDSNTHLDLNIIGDPNITYSFVSDGYEGEGNMDTIPYFCDLDSGDLTLASNSPLLGSGENGSDIGALGVGCDPIMASLDHGKIVPKEFILYQNYPNPFNPFTTVRYALPENGFINITIYDMMGRVVKTLMNGYQTAGFQTIQWNATNNRNEPVSAGLYLFTIQAGEFRQTKKMVLLK